MKKSFVVVFCLSLTLAFGCSKPESSKPEGSEVTSGFTEESTDSIDVTPRRCDAVYGAS